MHQERTHIKKLDDIQSNILEVVSYDYSGKRNIEVVIKQPEFTSLCPMTGLPDFASIYIEYIPDQYIVELKSLKYYLLQYRNVGVFYEHLVNVILDHLVEKVKPIRMKIIGDFTPRGGIHTCVKASYPDNQ
ncbi:MAG: NADPH-dependent 7-cyano-7-deazaguanine reductase QueF [Candidatus Magnetomorum sp.]|nr:NADPH-dependent 7-cyano-7-deazaguanine reductase QueF [Candidatus Magnetomorum sp.]